MSVLIIKNAAVVTMDENGTIYEDGAVAIEGNRILAAGSAGEIEKKYCGPDSQVLNARGKLVMPGMTNLHYHTAMGKGFFEDMPLWDYLDKFWYPLIKNIEPEDVYWPALLGYSEAIRSGTTCVNDMYRQMITCAEAAEKIGIRAALCSDASDTDPGLDSLKDNEKLFREKNGAANGRIEVYVGFESPWFASEHFWRDVRDLADSLGTKLHIHLNESADEVDYSRRVFGYRSAENAYRNGTLGKNSTIAAHCVWLNDDEIKMFAETGTCVSHNPGSNAKLGNGLARLPEMLKAGLTVGIGHDDVGCNNSEDLFQTMKYICGFHRAYRQDSTLLRPQEVVKMATTGGARAMDHDAGSIEAGKLADLTILNLNNDHFAPLIMEGETNVYNLILCADGADVDTVIIDGNIVMKERELVNADLDEILFKANEAFMRVAKRIHIL